MNESSTNLHEPEASHYPRVSIIVAVRNMEKTIGRCIESIVEVKYPNKEILVVDDGSTDATSAIIGRYAVHILTIRNSGVSIARNAGLREATGDVIVFTDGDCWVNPDWIEKLLHNFTGRHIAAVGGYVDFEKTGILATALSLEYATRFVERSRSPQSIACINAAFRKDALVAVGGFRRIAGQLVGGEDIDLSYRLRESGYRLVYDPAVVVHHDGREMSQGMWKRNFRNSVVSVEVFHDHKCAWKDPFFNRSLMAEPAVLGLSLLSVITALVLSSALWPIFLLPPILWNAPLGVKTALTMRRPVAAVVVPLLMVPRSAAILTGAIWGLARLIIHGKHTRRAN